MPDNNADPCLACDHVQGDHDNYTKRCNECDCARYEWTLRMD